MKDDETSSNVLRYQALEVWPDRECNESAHSFPKGYSNKAALIDSGSVIMHFLDKIPVLGF